MNTTLSQLIRNLIDGADSEGCTDDLAVVNSADVAALKDYLEKPVQPIVVTMTVDGAISVRNVPAGQTVEVHDYGCPDDWEGYEEDEDGDVFQRIVCKE